MNADLHEVYADYLACLNARTFAALGAYVHDDVRYNSKEIGLSGYRDMLTQNVEQIPDLRFIARLVVVESAFVACRLDFHCTPTGVFMGLPVNARTIRFSENVFYEFRDGKIAEVWSVIDTAAIEDQL